MHLDQFHRCELASRALLWLRHIHAVNRMDLCQSYLPLTILMIRLLYLAYQNKKAPREGLFLYPIGLITSVLRI